MIMNNTVKMDVSENEFNLYNFCFFEKNYSIVFDSYEKFKRESRRHKFKLIETWKRVGYTRDNCKEPILTQEIKNKALIGFIRNLRVVTWDEFNNTK